MVIQLTCRSIIDAGRALPGRRAGTSPVKRAILSFDASIKIIGIATTT
jgi:hypothetical protein